MHPHCGIETSTKAELLLHFKENHRISQEINPDNIPSKVGKLSYKCIYDRQKCGKKLENVNKIASHICKTHLNKTVMKLSNNSGDLNGSQENQTANSQMVEKTFSFSNIFIVSYDLITVMSSQESPKVLPSTHFNLLVVFIQRMSLVIPI